MASMNELEISNRSISSDKSQQEEINDLLALSSLMSYHINSEQIISSESHLIHSKFQRLFHFLVTDVYNEPMRQALGDQISNLMEVDNALINLSRNATLKFRNYKQIREQVRLILFSILGKNLLAKIFLFFQLLASSSNARRNTSETLRRSTSSSNTPRASSFYSKTSLRYLLHSSFFKWFISIVICLDAVNYSLHRNTVLQMIRKH
jgi:hypothetical protein